MTVKPLDLQLEETNIELEEKKALIAEHQRECADLLKKKRSIEETIRTSVPDGKVKLDVTDHAVIRYMERVKGIDVKAIRDEILECCSHAKGLEDAANFNLFTGDYKMVIKNGSVITVLDRKK